MPFEIKFCNCLLRVRNGKCFKCSVPFGRTNDWQPSFRNKFWWANYKSATLSKFSLEKLLYRLFSEMASYLITSVWRRKSFARKQFIKFCLTRKPHKRSQMNWLVKESWHKHVFRYVVLSGEYRRHQWYKNIKTDVNCCSLSQHVQLLLCSLVSLYLVSIYISSFNAVCLWLLINGIPAS